jgi:hypothetical protein
MFICLPSSETLGHKKLHAEFQYKTSNISNTYIVYQIFGPTKENQIWRVKTNEELDKLIKHKNIINHIKAQRLSWFGHIQRMPDTRTVTKMFNWKPLTKKIIRKTQVQMGG